MKLINAIAAAAIIILPIAMPKPANAHSVAPLGHHYKLCVATRIATDCKTYANSREGLSLEMSIEGTRYPVHGTEIPYPHSHR